ncbi:MAG: flagellar hook-associated protein FlgL [Betaproteobacteria bacterium]|jgi:flagellar hook-associated protein 3 FlgL
MRIGTSFAHLSGSALMMDAQAKMYATQNELSSGKKVSSPSSDPVNVSQISTARSAIAMQASFTANQSFLEGELRHLESTLGAVGDVISNAQQQLISAGNGTFNNADRASVATNLSSLRTQLVALANTRSADGQYLFSGFSSNTTPFFQSGTSISYGGDNGTRGVIVASGLAIQSNSDGQSLFMQVPKGNGSFATSVAATNTGNGKIDTGTVVNPAALTGQNYELQFTGSSTIQVVNTSTNSVMLWQTYVPGQAITFDGLQVVVSGTPAIGDRFTIAQGQTASVFDALDQAIAALNTPVVTDADRAKVNDAVRQVSATMEQAANIALTKRSEVGGRMSMLDSAAAVGANQQFQSMTLLSRLQDVDYAEAASRFATQQTAVQAALAAYGQTAKMSLFDYLR